MGIKKGIKEVTRGPIGPLPDKKPQSPGPDGFKPTSDGPSEGD